MGCQVRAEPEQATSNLSSKLTSTSPDPRMTKHCHTGCGSRPAALPDPLGQDPPLTPNPCGEQVETNSFLGMSKHLSWGRWLCDPLSRAREKDRGTLSPAVPGLLGADLSPHPGQDPKGAGVQPSPPVNPLHSSFFHSRAPTRGVSGSPARHANLSSPSHPGVQFPSGLYRMLLPAPCPSCPALPGSDTSAQAAENDLGYFRSGITLQTPP